MMKQMCCLVVVLVLMGVMSAQAQVASFEDVNPPDTGVWKGADGSGAIASGPASFLNNYNADWGSFDGFAVSGLNDTTVEGWAGEFNAIAGRGLNQSPQYAISYVSSFGAMPYAKIEMAPAQPVAGVYVTNTNWAYYSLLQGDDFSKQFGGADGNDADWFKLTFTGVDVNDMETGALEFYLADYRFEDNALDYIVDEWRFVDLSPLGSVASIQCTLSSSDVGTWGMNTPAYFALDSLVVPGAAPFRELGVPGFDPEDAEQVNPIFRAWATACVSYEPATIDAFYAEPVYALGPVTGNNMDIVSLGELDGDAEQPGQITLVFGDPNDPNDPGHIRNQAGADFVVFENGFFASSDYPGMGVVSGQILAELAYVEVSTNGRDFVRFPSVTQHPAPLASKYGTLDPNSLTGLAGKHPNKEDLSLGTAFDLAALEPINNGVVDLNDVRFVRIVDIPGDGSSVDSSGHPIYDPFPTTSSGGFDLEAIGVLKPQQYTGDINYDGRVDEADLALLSASLGLSFGQSNWLCRTDLNEDWKTDEADLALLEAQMGSVESWRN